MSQEKIADNIFASIDIIVDKKLQQLSFDRTVRAEVVKLLNTNLNIYQVMYQGVKFQAFNTNNYSYQKKDLVWLLVPENDFDNDKFILGPISQQREKVVQQSAEETILNTEEALEE